VNLSPSFYNPAARNRIGLTEIAFWLVPIAAFFVFPGDLQFAAQVLVMALFAMSLGLILGFAGIVTLGHAAFFGLGAYATALVSISGYHEAITATILGGAAAALLAAIVGPLVLRLSGLSLMMMTLAICATLFEAANKLGWLTGGENGLGGVEFDPLLGLFRWSVYGQTGYLYALVWVFLLFLVCRALVGSAFGLALQGVRENALRMRLIGAPVTGHLLCVYVLSAFMAGVAGALSAQTTGFVGLDVLAVDLSISALVMLVLGGVGNIYGGLVGGTFYMVLRHLASNWNPYNWMFVIGVFLIAVVLLGQNGVVGIVERLMSKLQRAPVPPASVSGAPDQRRRVA
jgi:branched-chain amino acid transport system permease protein